MVEAVDQAFQASPLRPERVSLLVGPCGPEPLGKCIVGPQERLVFIPLLAGGLDETFALGLLGERAGDFPCVDQVVLPLDMHGDPGGRIDGKDHRGKHLAAAVGDEYIVLVRLSYGQPERELPVDYMRRGGYCAADDNAYPRAVGDAPDAPFDG